MKLLLILIIGTLLGAYITHLHYAPYVEELDYLNNLTTQQIISNLSKS